MADAANPFCARLRRALEDEALDRGVLVFAGSSDNDLERERELMSAFSSHRVDGLIVAATTRDVGLLARERLAGTAIVVVDGPPSDLESDRIVTDDYVGVRLAIAHLCSRGHRRIGYLGPCTPADIAARRYQAVVDELSAQGIELEAQLVRLNLVDADSARTAAAELMSMSGSPTALLAGNCATTVGGHLAVKALRLGRRVALVGFDDGLQLAEARITVVAYDPAAIGRAAGRILFRRIDGDPSPPVHLSVPPQLIPRGSGEIDVRHQGLGDLGRPRLPCSS
jgi:LacI family transcriptional regulator